MFFVPIVSAIPFFYSVLFALRPSPCYLRPHFSFLSHICGSFLPFACSLSLASGSDPEKTPSKSPFRPENLIILTFPSPKICTYQKFCVPLHQISGRPLIH